MEKIKKMGSDISGFHKLSMEKRIKMVGKFAGLTKKEVRLLRKAGALDLKTADMMIENVIGTVQMPFGIATNFLINGKDYLIPMALEEPSVVAAVSYGAKLARPTGGFATESDEPIMIGQIQLLGLTKRGCKKAAKKILSEKEEIIKIANGRDSTLIKLGGGLKNIEVRKLKTKKRMMLIVHLIVDVRDAMGANVINTMAEGVTDHIENITGGEARLRIISNLAVKRLARARAVWSKEVLGEDVIDGIIEAYEFAKADQYRCTTHNKGIMNGVDAVAVATCNDFRALEAGSHSYAAFNGRYTSLTKYEKDKNGNLIGSIEMPLAVGIVGGATRTNPIGKISLKILGVKSAKELAEIMAAVGLSQNFAALRALAHEGIQHGHMKLHAKNIAVMGGAKGKLIDRIAKRLVKEKNISVCRARELLKRIKLRRRKNNNKNNGKNKKEGKK